MKETREEFERRIYVVASGYGDPYVLVWKSERHKKDLKSKVPPERWDWATFQNYIDYLRQNE